MKVTVSEPVSWQRVLDFDISKEEVEEAYNKKLKTHRREIKIPGFRPGKAPIEVLKTRFGKTIRAEAIDELIRNSFTDACKEKNIAPISEGSVNDLKAGDDESITFSISTEVDPEVEISGYDKLKIKMSTKKIKPPDIEKALEDIRERMAEYKDVDRPSKKGDLATVEYVSVEIDGELRSDFKNPNYPIELGASKIKDFDNELIGASAGEVVDVKVKFPKDYSVEDVAGKVGKFKISVKKIQEKVIPEIDDAFLKKVGDFKDIDSLREHIKTDLERQERERAKNEAYNKAVDTIIKNNPFEVPPSRIERYIDYMIEEGKKYNQGKPAPPREEIAEKYREKCIYMIKRFRIIDYIATKEKIKATQAEVDKQIEILANIYKQAPEDLKQEFRKNGTTNRIRSDIREQKTLDFLIGELAPDEK